MKIKHYLIIIYALLSFPLNIFPQYSDSYELPELIPYRNGKMWGFCDNNKIIIIPLKYSLAKIFSGNLAPVQQDNKWGMINKSGEVVIKPQFDEIKYCGENLWAVSLNNKWGYLDDYGQYITKIIYEIANDFNNGMASVKLNNQWGFIDKNGYEIIPFLFDDSGSFKDGLAAIKQNGKWGFINKENKITISIMYENILNFNEGLAPVKLKGKWGFINASGKIIIPFQYENAGIFEGGMAFVINSEGKYACIDKKADEIFSFDYNYISRFYENLSAVKLNNKWGFIDKKGKMVISNKYEEAHDFSDGLAAVKQNGKWGFINREEKIIINFKYENTGQFQNNIALVVLDGKYGYIDKYGNEYWDDNIIDLSCKIFKDAEQAYFEGKYTLSLEMLQEFPIESSCYSEAIALMKKSLEKVSLHNSQNFVTVSGIISNLKGKIINGYVVFEDINNKNIVGKCRILSNGYYCIVLPSKKIYSYYIDAKDFYPLSRVVDFTLPAQASNHREDITLISYEEMKEQHVSIRINNIFFDFNESKLKPESYLELDRLFNFLNEYQEISVEISGHTDNVGSEEYNITLSQERANAVKDYLVSKGIISNRIISRGYGESNPVGTNDTDEGRQLNRRVEFKILK